MAAKDGMMADRTPPPLLTTHPHLQEFMKFLEHLNRESERGQVLICASMLDDLLLKTLDAFLIIGESTEKLLRGFNAPLGTFSARIEATHGLGLISDAEYHDATATRRIRNKFAHTLTASFGDEGIKSQCAALHFRAKDYGDFVVDPRGQFSTATTALILNLTNRPHYVAKKGLAWESWPY